MHMCNKTRGKKNSPQWCIVEGYQKDTKGREIKTKTHDHDDAQQRSTTWRSLSYITKEHDERTKPNNWFPTEEKDDDAITHHVCTWTTWKTLCNKTLGKGKKKKKKITLVIHNKSIMRRYNVEWTIKLVESESNRCTTMPP